MADTIDLPRVRLALAELDRIAAEHPDIRPIEGLEQLEQLIATLNQERLVKYRERQQ